MKNVATEHQEQKALFEWWSVWGAKLPYMMFAIPNGGQRNVIVAKKLKDEGVKRGVLDVFLAWPRNGYGGFFIELKRSVGGKLSKHQKECIEILKAAGYAVVIAHGWEDAAQSIKDYAFGKFEQ